MTDTPAEPDGRAIQAPATPGKKPSISMHEGVPVWHDCCSCEAEPYWAELAEEPGIDPDPARDTDEEGG